MPLPRRWPILVCLATAALAPARADAVDRTAHLVDASRLRTDRGDDVARHRDARWRAALPPRASKGVRAQLAALGRSWIAWDDTTGVPHRIVPADHPAPGVITSADRALEHARTLLARHVELLAPGATADDFVLVTNDLSAGLRTVAFAQHHRGMPVLGGQLAFVFKHDRLLAITSEALPHVSLPSRIDRVTDDRARERARAWLVRDLAGTARLGAVEAPVVLPLFGKGGLGKGGLEYREVVRVPAEVEGPRSRWSVWLDARTGEPVARRQELLFEVANVVYRAPVRHPLGPYNDYPAPFVGVTVDAVSLVTDDGGTFSYDTMPGAASNTPVGPFVALTNASGELASQQFQAIPGFDAIWAAPEDEQLDAQLSAFVHASEVKRYVRGIAPDLAWLDGQLAVTVNIDDECNAFSDGDSINFYRASDGCQNTGRIADVVYHEFGHSVHHQSLIAGIGLFDTALSEGISDYLAATMLGDSGMGRGFFYDDTPLRELDPPDYEYRWPDDRGEVHDEGRIIGGALWDLRKLMIAKYGEDTGVALTDNLWYESTRRAVDIPSMYLTALLVDDDDGTLANGTPNGCEINAAFGPHGLFSAGEGTERVDATVAADGVLVELQLALPSFPACPIAAAPTVLYRLREGASDVTELAMTQQDGRWVAQIPPQLAGSVVQYQVHVNYDNGTPRSLPDNYVDPWYELFIGETVPLFCTGFADGGVGWALDGFEIAVPLGTSGNRDPALAADDDGVALGVELSDYGLYSPETFAQATSPIVGTAGFANVRLQYRRWLTVEDGFFDQAEITADTETVWSNFRSDNMDFATFHHVDREWRFHDVDVTAQAADGSLSLGFTLASDGGLELGGWTIDELCVVGFDPLMTACGNGVIETAEQCDDGNTIDGDGCTATCVAEDDPNGPDSDDSGSSDDTGDDPGLDGNGLIGRGCGCNGGERNAGWLVLLLLALVQRQRGATRRRLPSCDSGTSGPSSASRSQS